MNVHAETMEKTIILHGNEDLAKVLEQAMPKVGGNFLNKIK